MEATITLRQPCQMHFRRRTTPKTKPARVRERPSLARPHAVPLDNGWSFFRVRVPW
jgi:hypothetical protein